MGSDNIIGRFKELSAFSNSEWHQRVMCHHFGEFRISNLPTFNNDK